MVRDVDPSSGASPPAGVLVASILSLPLTSEPLLTQASLHSLPLRPPPQPQGLLRLFRERVLLLFGLLMPWVLKQPSVGGRGGEGAVQA